MHYFSGKGCFEFLESMHYCIGILNQDFNIYAMQIHVADISSDAEIFKIFPELKEVSAEKNKTICFYVEESKIEKIMKQFLPKEQEIVWPKENTNEMKVTPRV